jgi:hypothetical protein
VRGHNDKGHNDQPQRARLLALSGIDPREIAAQFGVPLRDVEAWLSQTSSESGAPLEPGPLSTSDRAEIARRALTTGEFVTVYGSDDESDLPTIGIEISDDISHGLSDLVDALVTELLVFPGVDGVWREDREFISLSGVCVDSARLSTHVNAWIEERLRTISGST